MCPFNFERSPNLIWCGSAEAGISLLELMVAVALGIFVTWGGVTMLRNSDIDLRAKAIDQDAKKESQEFIEYLRKKWAYRLQVPTAGVPAQGFAILQSDGTPCPYNTLCPQMQVYLKRSLAGAEFVEEISIKNSCKAVTDNPAVTSLSGLNFNTYLQTACSRCPRLQLPGIDVSRRKLVFGLAPEFMDQKHYPINSADLKTFKLVATLGMQACFSMQAQTAPLLIDMRAIVKSQEQRLLRLVQKTQILPFQNFANILLEQP
ncbi:MAG: hypothetical protein NTX25_02540 [Proteobacteria bacterium]|nr:hypothetical protein [Pseudomonadota bacterium]